MKLKPALIGTMLVMLLAAIASLSGCDHAGSYEQLHRRHNEALRQYFQEKYDSAMVTWSLLLADTEGSSDPKIQAMAADAYLAMGVIFARQNDFHSAYSQWLTAEEICDKYNLDQNRIYVWTNIGWIHMYIGDAEGAVKYWEPTLKGALEMNIPAVFTDAATGLFTYFGPDSPNRFSGIMEAWRSHEFPDSYPMNAYLRHFRSALTDIQASRPDSALANFDRMERSIPADFPEAERSRAMVMRNRIQLLESLGRTDAALAETERLKTLIDDAGLPDMHPWAFLTSSRLNRRAGRMSEVEHDWARLFSLPDTTLLSLNSAERLQQMASAHLAHRAGRQATRATMHARKLTTSLIFMGAALTVIALLLWLQHRQNRRLRQANQSLYDLNQQMRHEAEQQRRLRREMEHQEPAGEEKYGGSALSDQDKAALYRRIINYMESSSEIYNPDFGIATLAAAVDSNVRYVSQTVNERSGKGFPAFLGNYRIQEACRQLSSPDTQGSLTIEAIANNVGYSSRSAFSAVFKRVTGLSPSEYLKIAQRQA